LEDSGIVKVMTGEISEIVEPTEMEKTVYEMEIVVRKRLEGTVIGKRSEGYHRIEGGIYHPRFYDYSGRIKGVQKIGKVSIGDGVRMRKQIYEAFMIIKPASLR
jgi:hypothetical protein